jgi:ankyrin repeat protein
LEAIKLLLDRGAAINAVDRDGKSVLYYALVGSQGGCPELLRFLIDRGCDFHIVDPKCGSLLFYAAMKGFSAIVDELLQASDGSDIDLNPIDLQLLRSHFQSEEAYDSDEELVNQSLWSTLFKACPQVGALYKDLRLIALQLEIGEHYLAIDRCAYRYYAEMDKLGLYNLSNPPANPSAE